MRRRSGAGRPVRLAAAIATGGILLVPAVFATSAVGGALPFAGSGVGPGSAPSAGDLLAALRRAKTEPEEYGAGGNLPEADTLSPELLAALGGPGTDGFGSGAQATIPPGPLGIPGIMLEAYIRAEQALAVSNPTCGITWSVLASIGRIESNHARGGAVDDLGNTIRPILGPQLAGGPGMAAIRDTDGGRLDGDTVWDRAVGPMQFIPGTWARYSADGDGDGNASPHNVYDATKAAANYLCASGEDLRDQAALARSIFRYNHSDAYVANVLTWAAAYAAGVTPLPSTPGPVDDPPTDPPPIAQPPGTTPPGTTTPPTSTTTTTTPPTTTPTCPTPPPPSSSTSPTETTTPTPTTTTPLPPGCETTTTPPPTTTTSTTVDTSTEDPPAGTSTAGGSSPAGTSPAGTSPAGTSTEDTTTEGTTADTTSSGTSTTTSMPPA